MNLRELAAERNLALTRPDSDSAKASTKHYWQIKRWVHTYSALGVFNDQPAPNPIPASISCSREGSARGFLFVAMGEMGMPSSPFGPSTRHRKRLSAIGKLPCKLSAIGKLPCKLAR